MELKGKIERWVVKDRHRICSACAQLAQCSSAGVLKTLFFEVSRCPLGKHLSRNDAVAKRAWPDSAPPVSGCCDRMD